MKSWGEQQQFPTEVLSETEHLKTENQKLKERVVALEIELAKFQEVAQQEDNLLDAWIAIAGEHQQWARAWKRMAKEKRGYLNCAAKIASKYILKTVRLQQSRGRLVNAFRRLRSQ